MSDIETRLTAIFSQQGDYVDLRALRDILAPNDVRDAAKLIESKKLRDARAQLESNGIAAVRSSSDGKFEVHVDLALEYTLFKNKDLKQLVTHVRNNCTSGIKGILNSTPGLVERVQTVFGAAGIRHVRLDGKFYFATPDLARLVLWDDVKKTPNSHNTARDVQTAAAFDTTLQAELKRVFQFGSGPKTPILDIRGAARLWMCLPGAKATSFRATVAETWIRVFGGDETLIEEIHRNKELQTQLPRDHIGRAFSDAIDQRSSERTGELTIPGSVSSHNDAYARFMQVFEVERASRLLLESRLDEERAARELQKEQLSQQLSQEQRNRENAIEAERAAQTARLQVEATARIELANALVAERVARVALEAALEEEKAKSDRLQTICTNMSEDIIAVRSTQRVEYNAEAFQETATLETFLTAPADTAIRFKDLFRFMGVVGVEEEGSLAAGRCTRLMAPGIGQRKQRGRNGDVFVTINYRKRHAPVMLRGIQRACLEFLHTYPIEHGYRCVCADAFGLRRVISDHFHTQ